MSTRSALTLAVAVAASAVPGRVFAHPLVDDATRAYQEADFPAALAALDRAEASWDLTHDDLVRVLLTRALVYFGIGGREPMERALLALLVVEPSFEPGDEVPPPVRARLESLRGRAGPPPELVVETDRVSPDGLRIRAEVTGDPYEVVREVRIVAREATGEWERSASSDSATILVRAGAGEAVEYYAVMIGRGGAELGTRGTADDPMVERMEPLASNELAAPDPRVTVDEDDDDRSPRTGLIVGLSVAGAAVVAAIVVGVAVAAGGGGGNGLTHFGPPTVE